MLSDGDVSAAAQAMADARRDGKALAAWPSHWVPAVLDDCYRLQRAVAQACGGGIRGWKVAALTTEQRLGAGVPCPVAAPLLARWVVDDGAAASFDLARFNVPRLECEFAFELGADLPPRGRADAPYARADVQAAVRCLRIGIEVTDSRLPGASPFLAELADSLNSGAYVFGPACAHWQGLRFADVAIVLRATVDGAVQQLASGSGMPILQGDPLGALLLLANAQPAAAPDGLRAGQIVTTGTCTGAVPVPGACSVEADFGALGCVRAMFR